MSDTITSPAWIRPRRVNRMTATRSGVLSDTRISCLAGPLNLDLVVTEADALPRLELFGRITFLNGGVAPVPDIAIALVREEDGFVLFETTSDEFGEFIISVPSSGPVGLRVGEEADAPVVRVTDS
jgi:hypothetical protein